jgi:hypothetical protein
MSKRNNAKRREAEAAANKPTVCKVTVEPHVLKLLCKHDVAVGLGAIAKKIRQIEKSTYDDETKEEKVAKLIGKNISLFLTLD